MRINLLIAAVFAATIVGMTAPVNGRGFGGGHGGGAGGFGGGNFGGGNFGGGGFAAARTAGMGSGGFGGGGFHGGGGGDFGGGFRGNGGGFNGGEIHAYSGNGGGGMGGMHAYNGNFGGGAHNVDSGLSRFSSGNFQAGLSSMERSSGGGFEGRSSGEFHESSEAGAGRFADGSDMPDTLRVSQAALPTDMGGHASESFSGYSGSDRGLSPLQSHEIDQNVSQGFSAVNDIIGSAERQGDAEARAAEHPATGLGERARQPAQGVASNIDRSNVASRATSANTDRGDQARVDARGAALAHGAGNHIDQLQNAASGHPMAAQNAAAAAKSRDDSWNHQISPADLHIIGNQVRHDYVNQNAEDNAFYNNWGGVWLGAAMGAYNPWYEANWSNVNTWYGTKQPPVNYEYGNDLTYDNGNVLLYNKPIATAQQYWQSANNLVVAGAETPPKDSQWLSLGVFAAVRGDKSKTNMQFQLAIDKQATVRGNYYNSGDKNAQPIEGAVDKDTQRICWAVADRKNIVFDTGLYNLTQPETTLLVHFGADKTEQWTLVRLQKPDKASGK